ncbi:MAG: hypothetical protein LBP59_12390 [Planctomycetaceae bacterium]|jgi:ribonuclease HII|nr:hypothetical protein [Planctomycetaceae bacterium]
MYIIGTDEAGYGPNLGPLVVTATLWEMFDFNFSSFTSAAAGGGIEIGDSKKLYHSGGSLAKLSKGVLAALASINIFPKTDSELFEVIGRTQQLPLTFAGQELSLQKISNEIKPDANLNFPSNSFRAVKSNIIFPAEYNALINEYGSKGELLSNITLKLVVNLINGLGAKLSEPVLVLCDKHGGRNRYADLLATFFQDELINEKKQSREISIYNLKNTEFRFIAKGESQIPIALASMFSKYARELLMLRFNLFWKTHIPNIKPTAGYPEDAKRFLKEIEHALQKLKIDKNEIWRIK